VCRRQCAEHEPGPSNRSDGPEAHVAVAGTLTATDEGGGRWTVDLECSRITQSGLLLIGGEVLSSTQEEFPVGSDTAMIFQRGSPPKAIIHVPLADPPAASCAAFLENLPVDFPEPGGAQLEPIDGSLFLRP
jgi:hypothetical protein